MDTYGVNACVACPALSHALEGSISINDCKCDVGTYFNAGDQTCTSCATGLLSPIGSTSAGDCVCPVNEYQDSGTSLCAACPQYSTSVGVIAFAGCICIADSYMDAGTSLCVPCDAGYVSVLGSVDVSACVCAADTYLDGGACVACPTWSNTNGVPGATLITQCVCEIHRVYDAGLETCPLVCPATMRTVPTGDVNVDPSECETCPNDTYAMGTECIHCPEYSISASGSSSLSDCVCNPGTIMNTTAANCDNCGHGNYCPGSLPFSLYL